MNLFKAATSLIGLLGLRRKLNEGAEELEVRLEILKLEWQLETRRWAKLAVWGFLAAVAVFMTLLVLTLLVVALGWDSPDRLVVVACVAGFWVLVCALAIYAALKTWRERSDAFAVTRSQIKGPWRKLRRALGSKVKPASVPATTVSGDSGE